MPFTYLIAFLFYSEVHISVHCTFVGINIGFNNTSVKAVSIEYTQAENELTESIYFRPNKNLTSYTWAGDLWKKYDSN